MEGYYIKADAHTYVSLYWGDKLLFCCDNDFAKAEDIIAKIEKRARTKITELPILGTISDFDGFFWRHKMGWHNLITGK